MRKRRPLDAAASLVLGASLLLGSWQEVLASSLRSGVPAVEASGSAPGPAPSLPQPADLPAPDIEAGLPPSLPALAAPVSPSAGSAAPEPARPAAPGPMPGRPEAALPAPAAALPAAPEAALEERVWARAEARGFERPRGEASEGGPEAAESFRATVHAVKTELDPGDAASEGDLDEAAEHAGFRPYSPEVAAAAHDLELRERLEAEGRLPAAGRLAEALERQVRRSDLKSVRERQEQRGAAAAMAAIAASMAFGGGALLQNPAVSFLGVLFLTLAAAPVALTTMLLMDSRLTPSKRASLAALRDYARRRALFRSLAPTARLERGSPEAPGGYRTPSPPPRARIRVRVDAEARGRELELSAERAAELEEALLEEARQERPAPRRLTREGR